MVNLAQKLVSLEETFSVPELNQRFWTRMTGTEIAAHNAAAEPLNILCIDDGAGFLKNHVYVISDDGIIADVFAVHDHTSTATGGTLYEIKRANYKNIIEMDCSINMNASDFYMTERSGGTGGLAAGTLTNEVDNTANTKYIQLTTAGTNASTTGTEDFTNGQAGGGRLFFGKPITLQIKYAISNNTSVAYRMGCGAALMGAGVGTNAQMGFEGCTGTNTLNRVFSADGTTWTSENMADMVQTVPEGLRIDWYPSSKIVATDGEGNVVTKVSNLPPIGTATNANATFRCGIIQLAPSASRNLKIYSMRLVGDSYDSQSGIKGWL